MFTSDVSARGVDYPDVTHVIQVGMAPKRESYIHRLGRTGKFADFLLAHGRTHWSAYTPVQDFF
jgi:superfamily II DNA/RNA helicase